MAFVDGVNGGVMVIDPGGNVSRGPFSSIFNKEEIAKEDFERQVALLTGEQMFNSVEAEINRKWQEAMNDKNNAFNASEAQKNRDWQQMMSDTAIERAYNNMKKVGINPILAYTQQASSPSGGVASGSSYSSSSARSGSAHYTPSRVDDVLSSVVNALALIGSGLVRKG